MAAERGDLPLVETLLADPCVRLMEVDGAGVTALHRALAQPPESHLPVLTVLYRATRILLGEHADLVKMVRQYIAPSSCARP